MSPIPPTYIHLPPSKPLPLHVPPTIHLYTPSNYVSITPQPPSVFSSVLSPYPPFRFFESFIVVPLVPALPLTFLHTTILFLNTTFPLPIDAPNPFFAFLIILWTTFFKCVVQCMYIHSIAINVHFLSVILRGVQYTARERRVYLPFVV